MNAIDEQLSGAQRIAVAIAQNYLRVRVLPDGSIAAIGDLIFTRAIFLGCTSEGFAARFCFEDQDLADLRFDELQSEDDEPHVFMARRGG